MLDERFARALHVDSLRRRDLHPEHERHVLFQASTIGALLDGAYEGDVRVEELAEHGDLGLGTFDHLDGEMIVVDGEVLRADFNGNVAPVVPGAMTPFAAVTWFDPGLVSELDGPLAHADLLRALDRLVGDARASCAVRIDGDFTRIRARSVPRQEPPYRPLAEVVSDQHVFELAKPSGTVVGFRFPDFAEGIEVAGYHLHFVTTGRDRGGHVLDCHVRSATARVDVSSDLHVELPPGVDLDARHVDDATREAIDRVERRG
jgi:acetolactate decarboxylase